MVTPRLVTPHNDHIRLQSFPRHIIIAEQIAALEWTSTAVLTTLHLGPQNFNFFDLFVHRFRIT